MEKQRLCSRIRQKKNPYNALIYFSEGAYIELLQDTKIPNIVKLLRKLFGMSKKMERFFYWDRCEEGWCGLCIEKDGSLEQEIAFLKNKGINGVHLKKLKRVDTKGRRLEYQYFFPEGIDFPFLMNYFGIDPKPSNFVHPNGIRKIKKVVFRIDKKNADILKELLQDDRLEILVDEKNKGISEVEYE